jgi:HTH-type transcriptional regulator/antitoxin HigA
MTTGKIEAQPFLIKIITDRISEYETARNESLVLKNDSSVNDNGLAALLTLMGHRKLKNLALVDVLGSTSLISQILNGKRALTVPHIYALAKFFNVKPSVFL